MPQTPPQTDTYNTALDIFDRTHPLRVDVDENLKVNLADGSYILPVVNQAQLIPFAFDYVSLSPTGTNPTTIVYKTGGPSGTTVATLTLTYDGNNNVQTVTRT